MKSKYLVGCTLLCLSFLSLTNCSKSEEGNTVLFVENELQLYFDRFEAEAAERGMEINLSNAQIEGYIDDIETPSVAGQCTSNSDEPNRITIDEALWNRFSDLEKEYLIFHELGHCYLGRGHRDDINADGSCASMMQSGTISCRKNYNTRTRTDYLDELFE